MPNNEYDRSQTLQLIDKCCDENGIYVAVDINEADEVFNIAKDNGKYLSVCTVKDIKVLPNYNQNNAKLFINNAKTVLQMLISDFSDAKVAEINLN